MLSIERDPKVDESMYWSLCRDVSSLASKFTPSPLHPVTIAGPMNVENSAFELQ